MSKETRDPAVVLAEKTARFKRTAQKRLDNVLAHGARLARCANTATYHYTDQQAEAIVTGVEEMAKSLRSEFIERRSKQARIEL